MTIEKTLLSGSTPMLILALLKDGDKYGYEMISELAKRSDNTFQMKEGTLYPLLTRMKNEELLTYRWQESTSGPPRKYYALTEQGQELLAQLHDEWKSIQKAVATINVK